MSDLIHAHPTFAEIYAELFHLGADMPIHGWKQIVCYLLSQLFGCKDEVTEINFLVHNNFQKYYFFIFSNKAFTSDSFFR
jgi:hypothetical protein